MKDDKADQERIKDIDSQEEISNYFSYLDTISKALSNRLDQLDGENKVLKGELNKLRTENLEKEADCVQFKEQIDIIDQKYIELNIKYTELQEKYENVQKRYKLLEVENARNMDELKSLRKENKLLQSQTNIKVKETLREKINKLIK